MIRISWNCYNGARAGGPFAFEDSQWELRSKKLDEPHAPMICRPGHAHSPIPTTRSRVPLGWLGRGSGTAQFPILDEPHAPMICRPGHALSLPGHLPLRHLIGVGRHLSKMCNRVVTESRFLFPWARHLTYCREKARRRAIAASRETS